MFLLSEYQRCCDMTERVHWLQVINNYPVVHVSSPDYSEDIWALSFSLLPLGTRYTVLFPL